MELAIAIIGLLVILVPFGITLYNRAYGKRAKEKKRIEKEKQDLFLDVSVEQDIALEESKITGIQNLVEEQFFAGIDYKKSKYARELALSPTMLRKITLDFARKVQEKWKYPVIITRIKGKIEGDSGVHAAYRAVDIRDEHNGTRIFNDDQVTHMLNYINKKYSRTDGKKTLMHHNLNNGPEHFHLQIRPEA